MATKEELERETVELREENERLRAQLADAQSGSDTPARPEPVAPSFGMCEGVRADLEQVPETTDPFTGEKVTRS